MNIKSFCIALLAQVCAGSLWAQSYLSPFAGLQLSSDYTPANAVIQSQPRFGGSVGVLYQQQLSERWHWSLAGQLGVQTQTSRINLGGGLTEQSTRRGLMLVQPSAEYRLGERWGLFAGWYVAHKFAERISTNGNAFVRRDPTLITNRFNTGGAFGLRFYAGAWMLFAQANHDVIPTTDITFTDGSGTALYRYRPYHRGLTLGLAYRFGV